MFMLQSPWIDQRLVYDVSDPLHPRLICKIDNTSAHFVTGDTIEWLVKNMPESNGRVGMIGSSYEGFTVVMALRPIWSSIRRACCRLTRCRVVVFRLSPTMGVADRNQTAVSGPFGERSQRRYRRFHRRVAQ